LNRAKMTRWITSFFLVFFGYGVSQRGKGRGIAKITL